MPSAAGVADVSQPLGNVASVQDENARFRWHPCLLTKATGMRQPW